MFASSEGFFFFLTEHNLYKFAHNEVSSIYTLICSLNPRLTLLTIKTGLTEVLNQVWYFFAAVLQLKSLLNPGRYFGFREYSLKTFIGISEEIKADSLKLRQNGQQKTCNLFCNIAAKRFE